MKILEENYYGSLCTLMYEILHPQAPQDELEFYLSYAKTEQKILEPLCGSGRFLVPFLKQGFNIEGMDASEHMLNALKAKAPGAKFTCSPILSFKSKSKFDYIFITSGSVSLFTDLNKCEEILLKIKNLLTDNGVFVFAVDTVANIQSNESDYTLKAQASTKEGHILKFLSKDQYQEQSQTQFMHSIYQLCKPIQGADDRVLQQEYMNFQTHMYRFGEMEQMLSKVGFSLVKNYCDFAKNIARSDQNEMFLFECRP